MIIRKSEIHHILYILCLTTLAIALPLSKYVTGMAGVLMAINWVVEWNWREKWNTLKNNNIAILLSGFFFALMLCLLKSNNIITGILLLKVYLPFLYLPLFVATSKPISKRDFQVIILAFILSVFITTIISTVYFFSSDTIEIRKISRFVSHIRFGLMILFSISVSIYFAFKTYNSNKFIKYSLLVISIWFILYLFIAQTMTSIILLVLYALLLSIYLIFNAKQVKYKAASSIVFILFIVFCSYFGKTVYNYFHIKENVIFSQLPKYTIYGSEYSHDTVSYTECGHIVGLYISKKELNNEWKKRSFMEYDDFIEATLIRYLNSKGLTKDRDGVKQLSFSDINNIEHGIANYYYTEPFGIKKALYPTLFSISTKQILNSSLLQRLELWTASLKIIKRNFLSGVGIGDEKYEIDNQLLADNSVLTGKPSMGAHNQYLTFLLTGGVILLIYFIVILFYPLFKKRLYKNPLYIFFIFTIIFSCFTEDTLMTQAGLSFFALFNTLFIFHKEGYFEKLNKEDLLYQPY